MKRRDFLKTSVAAVGIMGSLTMEPEFADAQSTPEDSLRSGQPSR